MTDPISEQRDAIYIAVMCPELACSVATLNEPLLSSAKRGKCKTRDIGTNTDCDNDSKDTTNTITPRRPFFPGTMALGTIVGFFIQVVSLGAYGIMLLNWGEDALHASKSNTDWFLYAVLAMLTQIDLCIYVVIWVAFTCTMTRSGMAMVRNQLFMKGDNNDEVTIPKKKRTRSSSTNTDDENAEEQAAVNRRFVFIMGVYFLVGIVFGAFGAWTMIDVFLGFPIPFLPIVATVAVDLVLCYLMVWCYDLGKEETSEDEDDAACC